METCRTLRPAFLVIGLAVGSGPLGAAVAAETAATLWAAYRQSPDAHPLIPNCSFAGYRAGEAPIPDLPAVADVRTSGARGDGVADDSPAFAAAIAQAAAAGGGAVLVPAGTYRLTTHLRLAADGIVLRGVSTAESVLDFAAPLTATAGELPDARGISQYWWAGGLVWIGPADTFDGNNAVTAYGTGNQAWEYWRPGAARCAVAADAAAGARTVEVDAADALAPGATYLMTWTNPADASLLRHIYGDAGTADGLPGGAVGDCSWILPPAYPQFQWPVRIAAVDGTRVTLAQPLRLDARTIWGVAFRELGTAVRGSGIEHLRIRGHAPATHSHLSSTDAHGWNGIYVNRAIDCWVRDVRITDMEDPLILAAAKRVTATGVLIDGPAMNHHSLSCRVASHDNLFEDFRVDGPQRVKHGTSIEWFSSGNVWSRGFQRVGTFDSHRALSFDCLRTQCTVADDDGAGAGGDASAGPYVGKRCVQWNVEVAYDGTGGFNATRGRRICDPAQYVLGALVGVRGTDAPGGSPIAMPPGDKGTIVADAGSAVDPPNLYEAQRALRLAPPSTPEPQPPGGGSSGTGGGSGDGSSSGEQRGATSDGGGCGTSSLAAAALVALLLACVRLVRDARGVVQIATPRRRAPGG